MKCKNKNCTYSTIPLGKYCELHRTCKKLCIQSNCKVGAQGKTDYCKAHGGGKRCIEPNCKVSARGTGSSDYCVAHGGGKRCLEPNCKSGAEGRTNYCKTHGGGKRCIEPNCKVSAVGRSDYCIAHGGGKRCLEPNCKVSAAGSSVYCITHGGGKRCIELDCKFGAKGRTDYCIAHGGGKRCIEPNCKSSARGRTEYCVSHGGGDRCPNCIDWIDSRCGTTKYDGYCATCFKRVFPMDPRSTVIYEHTKETRVRNAIIERSLIDHDFLDFVHDKPLYTSNCDCTHRRRVDHRKIIGNTIIAVETDEHAHSDYDEKDEEVRYDDLYMIHSGRWIFIRFNPDNTRTDKTDIEDRIEVLLDTIETHIQRIKNEVNTDPVEIYKLYYS